MAVDEERLLGIITTLNEEMNMLNIKRTSIRSLSEIANSIKLLSIPATVNTLASTTLPLDPKLGITIEESRRVAIYEKLLVDISSLNPPADAVTPDPDPIDTDDPEV